MNHTQIAKYRLSAQQMTGTEYETASQMVHWFGAVQGQEYAQTKWGLGLRLPALRDEDVEKELDAGNILRTHLLRPTWHFVHSKDIRWMIQLTAPRIRTASSTMNRQLELTPELLTKCNKLISKALENGEHLTREEIGNILAKKKIQASGMRLMYIMFNAELDALVCSGRRRGNQHTYALIDQRIKSSDHFIKEEAVTELTQRYFQSRGPATAQDLATWSGLKISDCKWGIERIKKDLETFKLDGLDYYFIPGNTTKNTNGLFLLPEYDEMIMGYKDRQALMQHHHVSKVKYKYTCMILSDGQVIGTYRRLIKGAAAHFEFDYFRTLKSKEENMLKQQLVRFEEFTGMKSK